MNTETPTTTQRSRQRDATRLQVLQTGMRVVAEQGFAGATTAAIAKACGKAHGTVFVHFATRDLLVAEIVQELGHLISQSLSAYPAELRTVADVLDAHLAALAEHEVLYARLLTEAAQLPPVARARLFALQSGLGARLRQAHAQDLAAGLTREMDAVMLANTWIALTNHYLIHRDLFAPGGSVLAQHGAALKAHLLNVLKA
jgi:AcrR family transcriptional regulator